jgi:hypothetical protein
MAEVQTYVLVEVKTLEHLKDQALWLECLETAGVDNWEGMEYASELYHRVSILTRTSSDPHRKPERSI